MKLEVKSWETIVGGYHRCRDIETGDTHYVDLFVDGTLTRYAQKPKELIGKVVEVDYLTSYLEIGCNARVCYDPATEQEAASAAADVQEDVTC